MRRAVFPLVGFKHTQIFLYIFTMFTCIIHNFLEQILRTEEIWCILNVLIYLDNDLHLVSCSGGFEIFQGKELISVLFETHENVRLVGVGLDHWCDPHA